MRPAADAAAMPFADATPRSWPAALNNTGTTLAKPSPTSAKPASAAQGCGGAGEIAMPTKPSAPLDPSKTTRATRARTQSPAKRPAPSPLGD